MRTIKALSRFVDVGGIKTHYYDTGDGPVVVLLHSGEFGSSAELTWERSIDVLGEHFRVVAPDWLGYGLTDKIRDFAAGSDRMIRHLTDFLRVLAIDEAHFVGVSMGATMLLREAARPAPRLPIVKMVITSGGGLVVDNRARQIALDYDGTPDSMRALLSVLFADQSRAADDDYVARRVAASTAPGAWEAIAASRFHSPLTAPRSDFGHADTIEYESVRFPTLVLAGGRDQLREPGFHTVFRRIPHAEVVVIDDAGHLLNIERADFFNAKVLAFLSNDAPSL